MPFDPQPCPPHLSTEFFLWLWWHGSEKNQFNDPVLGPFEIWMEDKIVLEGGAKNAISGDSAAKDSSAFEALSSGKRISAMRIAIRRDDRDFILSVKEGLLLDQVKLPTVEGGDDDGGFYEAVFLIEEVRVLWNALFGFFATARVSTSWPETVEEIKAWLEETSS